ncbi:hypothetical protein MA16_Dca006990 [Dendrobium catenatum]|uniref:Uncharacterized protein n=1 Tax=Dendrobium catenatum TaxID=906689 RepID=A0A2I0VX28_9ASPA|nr:hypothetical protein MA16_Dca006990 [Dendrobium catenatum]
MAYELQRRFTRRHHYQTTLESQLDPDVELQLSQRKRANLVPAEILYEDGWTAQHHQVLFIENLLGEIEKKTWIQWRMAFELDYEALVNIADDPQNVLSQIRRIITLEDPYQGSTEEQNRAYLDLERLSCDQIKNMFEYMNDYKVLAAKSGRMYISSELSEKFFKKMPPLLGEEVEKAFKERHPGNTVGVLPRIKFMYQYLADLCKKAAIQRGIKDLSICQKIPMPGYYNTG